MESLEDDISPQGFFIVKKVISEMLKKELGRNVEDRGLAEGG